MIKYPYKRIFGILGPNRVGKDTIAQYLQESRDFEILAFADQIKEEFGISIEDFERAKLAGNVESLRKELWNFSANKKEKDPYYFIAPVIHKANISEKSVVITDIRTEEEFVAFFELTNDDFCPRIYSVGCEFERCAQKYRISGTQISKDFYLYHCNINKRILSINNDMNGLREFFMDLDDFFIQEDIMDLAKIEQPALRNVISLYLKQFNMKERR